MRKAILSTALICLAIWPTTGQINPDLSSYVNPFAGTMNMGHTFPGASMPFGFVQLSPDTDTVSYELNGRYNGDVYR